MTDPATPATLSHEEPPPGPVSRVGTMLLVAVTILVLHQVGRGSLAAPPVGSLEELGDWARDRDPIAIGFAVVRAVALVVAYHLAATTVLMVVGKAFHRPSLVHLGDAVTLPPLRGTVRRLVGLGLSTGLALSQPLPTAQAHPQSSLSLVAVGVSGDPHGRVVIERVEVAEPGRAVLRVESEPIHQHRLGDLPTLERIDITSSQDAPDPDEAAGRPTAQQEVEPVVTAEAGANHHLVEPGDHLWSIAADRLARALGRSPTDAEVAPYWESLVAANPQLVDPNLLFPGDRVEVPPPPGPS